MATVTDREIKTGYGRMLSIVREGRGNGVRDSAEDPSRSARNPGKPWRFVLIVGPTPDGRPVPFTLDEKTVRGLGPGATLLREPFPPMLRVRFDWPAPTLAEAIAAAVARADSVGLPVLRVDNDDWVTAADVAHRVGRSRETVRQWAIGRAGPQGFPPPANPRRDTTFYSWAELLPWLRAREDLELPEEEPSLVAANLAVRLRALLPQVSRPSAILDLLHGQPPAEGTSGAL